MRANPSESQELIHSVLETLEQGEALLTQLSDEDYTRKVPIAFNASIGGHYRHCLDHFRSLLNAAHSGDLNYDHRERGTLIEHDRFAALNATRELCSAFQTLPAECLRRELQVTCKTSYAESGSQVSGSTLGRESSYAVFCLKKKTRCSHPQPEREQSRGTPRTRQRPLQPPEVLLDRMQP